MVNEDLKVFFTRVTKTASSALIQSFKIRGFELSHLDCQGALDKNHVPLPLFAEERPEFPLSDYYKFAFVRNPWDRILSACIYSNDKGYSKAKFGRDIMLTEFLSAIETVPVWRQKYLIPQNEFVKGSDFVGRFENLEEDFTKVQQSLGLADVQLPILNETEHGHYSDYYSQSAKDKVACMFSKDLTEYGYEFEG